MGVVRANGRLADQQPSALTTPFVLSSQTNSTVSGTTPKKNQLPNQHLPCAFILAAALATSLATQTFATPGDDPFADGIVEFDDGIGGASGFDDASTVLGTPERFTGEGIFPSVVSPFSPAFGLDELVSIGDGGFITVQFNTPVTDDANNPFGIDLLVFGNAGFIDSSFPNGVVGGLFGNDGGTVQVSSDGINFVEVPNVAADGMFPTFGYLDAGPYDDSPGNVLSDFTRPVDPSLTIDDFMGLSHAEVVDLYAGSGGGAGIDLATVGLSEISFVRVSYSGSENIEIEAFSDVSPIPSPGGLVLIGLVALVNRRRQR